MGADAYVKVVQNYIDSILNGSQQDLSIDHEYKGSDLTLFAEIKARFNLLRKGYFS